MYQVLLLDFDDTARSVSWLSYHNNYGISRNWKAWFSCDSSGGALNTYSTQIKALYDYGHEIANHATSAIPVPLDYLDTHTTADYYNNYVFPVDAAIKAIIPGFDKTKSYIYPSGQFIQECSDYMLDNNLMQIVRHGRYWESGLGFYDGSKQIIEGFGLDAQYGHTDQALLDAIDQAKNQNKIVIMYGHTIVGNTPQTGYLVGQDRLNLIIDYVNSNKMKMYRLDELLPSLFN
jgi:hypothetical protein